MPIVVREIETIEECRHFQTVEQRVWGTDCENIVPQHVLITLAHNGGLVMGAWADDGPADTGGMVGIVAGWLGAAVPAGAPADAPRRVKFCSHMAGVLPPWQRQRVGLQLKLAQRDWVLAQGLTGWMTWTFDPLQRANAIFNVHRLGATCRTYLRDLYGAMTDSLNAGGPSDRCQVDWWLRTPRVEAAIQEATAHLAAGEHSNGGAAPATHLRAEEIYAGLRVLPTTGAGEVRAPVDAAPPLDGAPLAVPLPADIGALRHTHSALALEWRHWLRAQLERAYAAGYETVDCLPAAGGDWCYILAPVAPVR